MARKTTIRNDDEEPDEPVRPSFGGVNAGAGNFEDPNQQRFDDELRPSKLDDVVS